MAWGDYEGNVFVWSSSRGNLLVVHDRTLSGPPPETGLYKVIAMHFKDDETLYWRQFGGLMQSAVIRGGKVTGKTKRKYGNVSSLSAAFTSNCYIDCASIRNGGFLGLSEEYILDKYDLKTGKRLATTKLYPMKKGMFHFVEKMTVSPDEKYLAVGSQCNAGIVRLRDFKLIHTFNIEYGTKPVFSPDSSRAAIGTKGTLTTPPKLYIFDVKSGKVVRELKLDSEAEPLAFRTNNVLWYSWRLSPSRVNLDDGKSALLPFLPQHPGIVLFSKDRRRLYVVSYGGSKVLVYELPRLP